MTNVFKLKCPNGSDEAQDVTSTLYNAYQQIVVLKCVYFCMNEWLQGFLLSGMTFGQAV